MPSEQAYGPWLRAAGRSADSTSGDRGIRKAIEDQNLKGKTQFTGRSFTVTTEFGGRGDRQGDVFKEDALEKDKAKWHDMKEGEGGMGYMDTRI